MCNNNSEFQNNQVGFLGRNNARGLDNARGFEFDNARRSDDNKGFEFDNFSGFSSAASLKPSKPMYNQDHHFLCHQNFTGSRLEACLRGEPWRCQC